MATTTYTGVIKAVREDKGYGFAKCPDLGRDVFLHIRDTDPSLDFDQQLLEMTVQFELIETPQGPRAINVRRAY